MKHSNGRTMEGEQQFIELRLPVGTKLDEFVSEICWQAWERTGTQLEAAASLGVRPETLWKKLKLKRQQLVRAGISDRPMAQ